MEFLLIISYYFCVLFIASRKNYSWRGWANAWIILFLFGSILRLILEFVPLLAPLTGRIILMGSLGILPLRFLLLKFHIKSAKLFPAWNRMSVFYIFLSFFVFFRNFYPQFDVDSLTYHLSAIQFLFERGNLAPIQRSIESAGVQFAHIGFEEFLLIPGLGNDLSLFGGFIQGLLKVMTMFSIFSLVPANANYFKMIAAYLLLIDDHFFFSGQNTFVYLNPSMIGLVAMAGVLSLNALRGRWLRGIYSIPISMGVAGDKYQGVYFLIPFALIASAGLLRSFSKETNKLHFIIKVLQIAYLPLISGALLLFASYGLNWILLGSPVYPFNIAWIKVSGVIRYLDYWQNFASTVKIGMDSIGPFRAVIFPGNLAMKISAVLAIPCILLFIFQLLFLYFGKKTSHLLRRHFLFLSSFGFVFTFYWAIQANNITSGESRYPRYVYGMSILSIIYLISALKIRFERIQRILVSNGLQAAILFVLVIYIVYTIDTRGYNVWPNQRPNNSEIFLLAKKYFLNQKCDYKQDPEKCIPYWRNLESNARKNISAFYSCTKENEFLTEKDSLISGNGILLMTPSDNWPRYLLARGAIRNDSRAGGYFRPVINLAELKSSGINHVLISRHLLLKNNSVYIENEFNGSLQLIIDKQKPICTSGEIFLYRL